MSGWVAEGVKKKEKKKKRRRGTLLLAIFAMILRRMAITPLQRRFYIHLVSLTIIEANIHRD